MSEPGNRASAFERDGDYEFPAPGRPGMIRLWLGRLEPADLATPDGPNRVVMTITTQTAEQAEAFREAVYELATAAASCGHALGDVQGAGPIRCGRPRGHEMHVGALTWLE